MKKQFLFIVLMTILALSISSCTPDTPYSEPPRTMLTLRNQSSSGIYWQIQKAEAPLSDEFKHMDKAGYYWMLAEDGASYVIRVYSVLQEIAILDGEGFSKYEKPVSSNEITVTTDHNQIEVLVCGDVNHITLEQMDR